MESPPQWRECDRLFYCRVNVAKALIAGFVRLCACPTLRHGFLIGDAAVVLLRLSATNWQFVN
jgi:hypothetical protein